MPKNDTAQRYALPAGIRYYGRLPSIAEVSGGHVLGTLGTKRADPRDWREPPHEVLANIPTYDTTTTPLAFTTKPGSGLADPKAVEMFVKRHGVLCAQPDETTGRFDEDSVRFADAQDSLRRAWRGDRAAIKELLRQVKEALEARVSFRVGEIEIATENLWSFLCALFLRDYRAKKTKVCARADCLHPYFLEKRKGQKYCSHRCAALVSVRSFREREKGEPKRRAKR